MLGNSWGGSWGDSWNGSWGFDAAPVVVAPPAPDTGGSGQVFRGAWRNHYLSTLPKKKRKLVDELDEMILALRERVVEAPPSIDEGAYERTLRVSQALANRQDLNSVANERIIAQIDALKRAIEEMDDEEVILMAMH